MLETIIGIILLPLAIGAVIFTGCMVVGFIKGISNHINKK